MTAMKRTLMALACSSVMVAPVFAEDETGKGWSGEVALSYLITRGNSESDTMQGKVNAERDGLRWRHTAKVEASNTQSEDSAGIKSRTGERYFSSYKLDRKLGD